MDDLRLALRTCTNQSLQIPHELKQESPQSQQSSQQNSHSSLEIGNLGYDGLPYSTESADSTEDTAKQEPNYFCVDLTAYRPQRCSVWCKCSCHSWITMEEYPMFTCLMGALLFSYCKTPLAYTKCSETACRAGSPVFAKVSYFFPPSLIRMMIAVIYMPDSPGRPSLGLVVPQLVSILSEEIWLSIQGDVKGMQRLVSARNGYLNVINEKGESLLHESLPSLHFRLMITNILSQYAAWEGRLEMARLLLNHGADPYQRDNNQM
jgi:hypothetical protein